MVLISKVPRSNYPTEKALQHASCLVNVKGLGPRRFYPNLRVPLCRDPEKGHAALESQNPKCVSGSRMNKKGGCYGT